MISKYIFLILVIMILGLSTISANEAGAQVKSVREVSIQLKAQKQSLTQIFKSIEQKTDFSFSYSVESLHKSVMVPYSSTGPGNMALGASSLFNTKKMYTVFSQELSSVGIFCNLSPVSDVNSNPRNPIIGTRSFGEDPEKVAERVIVAIEGLHSNDVIATAKHFPGHGNTAADSRG